MHSTKEGHGIIDVTSPEGSEDEMEELEELEPVNTVGWLPYLIKHLLIMVLGGGLLAVPVIVLVSLGKVDFVRAIRQDDPEGSDPTEYNLVRFFAWASAMMVIITLVSYIVTVLPRMILKITSIVAIGKLEAAKQSLEFYMALMTTIKVALSIGITFGLWCAAFPRSVEWDPTANAKTWNVVLFRVLLCLLIVTICVTVEKFILQLIAVRFHRTAYRQRLKDSNYATFVLDSLNKARRKPSSQSNIKCPPTSVSFASPRANPESPYSTRDSSFTQIPPKQKYDSIYNNINKTVFEGRYEEDVDLHSKNEARKLARKLFSSLQGHRRHLLPEDFDPLFPSVDEARKAFDYFDKDGNGDISKREMCEKITLAYKERKDLMLALRDTSQAVGKLDSILLIISLVVAAFSCSVVFGKNLYATLIPFGTFFLGLSFIFGDSAKELFQSIIFLFVMHPYDAGDRVYIENGDKTDNLLVDKVGLLGTKFTHVNGQATYIPHIILMKKIIFNIRRSTSQAEQIDFQVDFDTSKEKIIALKERLNRYLLEEESREFHADILLALDEIVNSNQLKLFIWLEHKGNWQDGGRRWARKTRFMIALREICLDLNMRYSLLPQKVHHLNPPPYPQPNSNLAYFSIDPDSNPNM